MKTLSLFCISSGLILFCAAAKADMQTVIICDTTCHAVTIYVDEGVTTVLDRQ